MIKRIRKLVIFFIMMVTLFTDLASVFVMDTVNGESVNSEISGKITFAMHKSESLVQPYIDKFMKKYPNIQVEYTGYNNYEETMKQLVEEGKELPDVFLVPYCISTNDSTVQQYLAPISDIQSLEEKYNYTDCCIQQNGFAYGIPSFAYTYGMIYNKDVFYKAGISEIPKTIEDFYNDCKLIKEHTDSIPFYCDYGDSWELGYWTTYPFIEMNGKTGYKYNDFIYKPNPFRKGSSHYKVYKLLYDLISNDYTEAWETSSYGDGSAMLARGDVACMSVGSWAYTEIQSGNGQEDNLGFMPFPNNIHDSQYATVGVDYCYGLNKDSDNLEAARLFLKYMIEDSGYATETGNISIVKNDPYPDFLKEMDKVVLMTEHQAAQQDMELLHSLQQYVNPDSTEELYRIVDAAYGKSNESFDSIMNDWNKRWEKGRPSDYTKNTDYNSDKVTISNSDIGISEAERKFIVENPQIRAGYFKYNAPFSYDLEDDVTGLSFEICDLIHEKTGLSFTYTGYDNILEAMDAIENDEIDILIGVDNTKIKKLNYSKAYYKCMDVYVVPEGSNKGVGQRASAALPKGTKKKESVKSGTIREYLNPVECVKAVEKGEADYTVMNYYAAGYYIKDMEYDDLQINPTYSSSTLHFAMQDEEDSSLMALINKCLYAVDTEQLQVNLLKYSSAPEKEMTLKRFIKANPIMANVIIIVVLGSIILVLILGGLMRVRGNRMRMLEIKRYEIITELADEYIFEYDCAKEVFKFDQKFRKAFGFPEQWSASDIEGAKDSLKSFLIQVNNILNGRLPEDQTFELKKISGESIWYKTIYSYVRNAKDVPMYALGKIVSVQQEVKKMMDYQEKADKDALTGIYNRRGFFEKVSGTYKKVLFVVTDLDDFKSVNDSIGHAGGDHVLKIMADSLRTSFGRVGYVGRYGGDEFVALVFDITIEDATRLLEQFTKSMDKIIEYSGIPHRISVSAGGVYSEDMIDSSLLFDEADAALYEKKANGKNGYIIKKLGEK